MARIAKLSWLGVVLGGILIVTILAMMVELGEPDPADIVVQISLIDPPDEVDYYDGIEARKPEILALFTTSELVELGLRSCELRDGYVAGSLPDHQSVLAEEINDSYRLPSDLKPDRVAGVVGNAADGSLCEATYAEQSR